MRQLDENLLKLTRAELIKNLFSATRSRPEDPRTVPQATGYDPVDHETHGVLEIESLVKTPGVGKRVQAERTPKTSAKKKKSSAPDVPGTEEERELEATEPVASEERERCQRSRHLLRRSGRLETETES